MTSIRTGRLRTVLLGVAAALLAFTPVYWTNAVAESPGTAPDRTDGQSAVRQNPLRKAWKLDKGISDIPVSFTVRNINRTKAACPVDGRTYTVRGHLTAPTRLLEGKGTDKAVTLYQHGIASGEWYWRLQADGYHHAEELAARGHASLTIDRIGYDSSGTPDGFATCVGGQADITHQIVQQLRKGTYRSGDAKGGANDSAKGGGRAATSFGKVFLAGQSNGGQIAQIAAYSFRDIDGLVLMDWADRGLTPQTNARFFSSLQSCLRGGTEGYVHYDLGPAEFRSGNFHDTDPDVLDLAVPHQNRHPCGDMVSQISSVLVDLRELRTITVPVLLMYGEKDTRVQGGEEHRALFTGAENTRLVNIPKAGHYMGMARQAPLIHETLADWLDAR
ncbi:alpha/beta hydrolase [Streptomyces yaizuensis]|uniref:Alpha/beta hydrolase n=1 Tax=Streptomyces yaizuensis TaxID=2989713 RepID=A0ABQ5P3B7_9ACTN|nr:alpha/beta hydrolase [Streptomyces sp. YSPA8]GLF96726.1 alpha/beta hydrolase [Streptomyces sp. YSPA8]